MADELAALREQLAAAQEELATNKEEKERVAKQLEQANAEVEANNKKKAYLDETGLTEAEFDDKKATTEVPLDGHYEPGVCLTVCVAGSIDEKGGGDEGEAYGAGAGVREVPNALQTGSDLGEPPWLRLTIHHCRSSAGV